MPSVKRTLLAVAASAVVLVGCDAVPVAEASMTATVNGAEWVATPQALVNRSGRLALQGWVGPTGAACPPWNPCEALTLLSDSPFEGVGVYELRGETGAALFSYMDGDAILAVYRVLGPSPRLTVDEYDRAGGVVSGRFEADFALEASFFPPGMFTPPDTVRVREGRFRAVLTRL